MKLSVGLTDDQTTLIGRESWFYYYLTGCIAISLLVYILMRDTRKQSAMNRHE